MSKRGFLEVLRETLSEELSQNVVNGHIQYYDQYISDDIRKGASETEVTGRLGDPRLIARTILETSGASGSSSQDGYGSQSSYSQSSYSQSSYSQDGTGSTGGGFQHVQEKMHNNPTVRLVLGILIVMGVIALIISIVSALLPVVLPIAAVLILLSFLRRKM